MDLRLDRHRHGIGQELAETTYWKGKAFTAPPTGYDNLGNPTTLFGELTDPLTGNTQTDPYVSSTGYPADGKLAGREYANANHSLKRAYAYEPQTQRLSRIQTLVRPEPPSPSPMPSAPPRPKPSVAAHRRRPAEGRLPTLPSPRPVRARPLRTPAG